MDRDSETSNDKELECPPTLVAESGGGKSGYEKQSVSTTMVGGEEQQARMPVLQPNVSLEGTRTKSGRIHKPARNFSSDEYVVATLTKRRPNNSRAAVIRQVAAPSVPTSSTPTLEDIEIIRRNLEDKYPETTNEAGEETPFAFIITVCFKDKEAKLQNISVSNIHTKVREVCHNWTKGPYKLTVDENKFVKECITKPEWSRIPIKDWKILAEALKDRLYRMRKRFSRGGRVPKTTAKRRRAHPQKPDPGCKFAPVLNDENSDDEVVGDDAEDFMAECDLDDPTPSIPRLSAKSSKTSSVDNDETKVVDFDLGSIDGITTEDLKDFDDLESAIVNESKNSGVDNSMVAALHATLHKDRDEQFDPSQYQPPALEKDGMYALEDMEGPESTLSFFENLEEPTFGDLETATTMSDEAYTDLEQAVDEKPDISSLSNMPRLQGVSYRPTLRDSDSMRRILDGSLKLTHDKLDLSTVEIEESSGKVRLSTAVELANPGLTMISTKTALMCALKISEDFLPSSHEKYLNRLEELDKYVVEDLDEIRKKFNMKPSPVSLKRKLALDGFPKGKPKVVPFKIVNGGVEKSTKPQPYLRSAYAKCRKFMEDETTPIEKLGDKKILAAGRIIELDYENYLKETDVEIPLEDIATPMPNLPPPSVSNCHAPSCRLGCICMSLSEDMPPRKHCGRPRCFFECTCQQTVFNNNDDGDIRSRLRPRVSLLNWRAESTEKEKEPMTSYRQMERGTHFIRVRRTANQPERLRREFVLDGKVVDRSPAKVTKERLRTKALLQSSHRRILAKPEGHRYVRMVVPPKADKKPKASAEKLAKKCMPLTVDVEHMKMKNPVPELVKPATSHKNKSEKKTDSAESSKPPLKMSAKDVEEMKSIIQEMTEDCQLMPLSDDQLGFFSWSRGIHPRVTMYQVMRGDELRVPWLYLPIPPPGYSWICHCISSTFEKTDYVYIPEIRCHISSAALQANMNSAFLRKKGVVFDVKYQFSEGNNQSGIGKIYFFPNLPKVLVCGPFRTDETTINPRDLSNADKVANALQHMETQQLMQKGGADKSWKNFTASPTIFPIKNRTDNETTLTPEKSRELFKQVYPDIIGVVGDARKNDLSQRLNQRVVQFNWTNAVKFAGIGRPNEETVPFSDAVRVEG